jgi:hypothetical protein
LTAAAAFDTFRLRTPLQLSRPKGGMIMRRILVVHSTSDPAVDDRISAMAKKPELAECEFRHATFIRPEDGEELSRLKPSQFLQLNELRIFRRIELEIEATKPELVVLHSGVAFSIAPQTVMSIFSALKDIHPQLKFGIQENVILDHLIESQGIRFTRQIDEVFDRGPEIKNIVKLMF